MAGPRGAGWVRRLRARTPLRVKLVAAVLLLVIAALAGSGLAAVTTLRSYLVGRVDDQLRDTERPIVEHQLDGIARDSRDDHGGRGGEDRDATAARQLPSAYVVEVTDAAGKILLAPTSALLDSSQPLPEFPEVSGPATQSAGRRTFTVPAVSGDGDWRVLAAPLALVDGTTGTLLIAQSLTDVQNTVDRLVLLLVVIGGVAVVVLAAVGYGVVRSSLKPLRKVEETAAAIAGGDLSRRVPDADPRTEVGQLAGALNTMLHEVETAFAERAESEQAARRSEDRMRRFVADASHELRTPLTSIRGFAELYRQGAAVDEADVRRMMRRIEDEAMRMGLLVEDLLMLARLDQQRPLERTPVDLVALAADAVHDAQAVAPERDIRLDVATGEAAVVLGDGTRLRQVLGNLVGNALSHTPAGSPVEVTVAVGAQAHEARLAVRDHGPGLSPADASRIFERFYRADASRTRAAGGTGLGLSIVAALVHAHGGQVGVDTAPGEGATFWVRLPLAEQAPRDPGSSQAGHRVGQHTGG
jgi:two-component system, OmpR family, sensor kinase